MIGLLASAVGVALVASATVVDTDWKRPDGSTFRVQSVGEGYPARPDADFAAATNFLFSIAPMPQRYRLSGGRYAGAPLRGVFSKETFPFPFEDGWTFFLDERPGANWGHPSRCVFLKGDLSAFAVRYLEEPVTAADGSPLPLAAGTERKPDPTLRAVRAAANAHVARAIPFTLGDAAKTYAILISGGYNRDCNYTRYWGDVAAVYSTLTKGCGVPKDNITVCMADGDDPAADVSDGEADGQGHSLFAGGSSPTDLDGDGSADYSLAATKANIRNAFSAVRSKLTADSRLFVFVTDHGVYDAYSGVASICLWGEDMMSASEFSALTSGVDCPVWYALEFCYAGAFVDSLASQGGVRFVAAAAGVEPSSAFPDSPELWYMNPWVYQLVGAMRGAYPSMGISPWEDGATAADADANGDGVVSVKEAVGFANAKIVADQRIDENPVWKASGFGSDDGLRKADASAGGQNYALCVGIDRYTCFDCPTLYGCVADAEAFGGMLKRTMPGGSPLFAVSALCDFGATRMAIRAAIQDHADRLQSGDTFVYYHSGHGRADCLCASDAEYTDAEIADDLCRFRSGVKVCVIVDSCFSGSLFDSPSSKGAANELPARVQALMQARLGTVNLLASSIGWVTAATAEEYSFETEVGGQIRGEFTYAFCSGLESREVDSDADGWGTAYEGWAYCAGLSFLDLGSTPQCHNPDTCRSVRLVFYGDGEPVAPVEEQDKPGEEAKTLPALRYSDDVAFTGQSSAKYVGWLVDRKGRFVGTAEVSAGRFSRGGTSSVKFKVVMAGNTKTTSVSCKALRSDGRVKAEGCSSTGQPLAIELTEKTAAGTFGDGFTFVCGRETKAVSCPGRYVLSLYAIPKGNGGDFQGYAGLSVDVKAKGTAKVTGTLPDGTKVSWTAKLVCDDYSAYLPLFTQMYSKRGAFGGLVFDLKSRTCVSNAAGYWSGSDSKHRVDADIDFDGLSAVKAPADLSPEVCRVEREVDYCVELVRQYGIMENLLPFGAKLVFDGKKWTSLGDSCKLKLSYASKTGLIAGSMKVFLLGKAKSAKVNGVWLGNSGRVTVSVKGQFGFGMLVR